MTNKDVEEIYRKLVALTEEERMEVLNRFCSYCGTPILPCRCWNDE